MILMETAACLMEANQAVYPLDLTRRAVSSPSLPSVLQRKKYIYSYIWSMRRFDLLNITENLNISNRKTKLFYFVNNHLSEIQVKDLSIITPNVLGACLECLYYPSSGSLHNNYELKLKLDGEGPLLTDPSPTSSTTFLTDLV